MRYFIVSIQGDYGWPKVTESQRHAAERWGAEYIEFRDDPRCKNVYDDAFYFLDDFNPEDEILHVDADVLYRIDCPSPFDYMPDRGIAFADDRDICLPQHSYIEFRGRMVTERWRGIYGARLLAEEERQGVTDAFPGNCGVLLGKQRDFKAVSELFYEMQAKAIEKEPDNTFHQELTAVAIHKLGMANLLPSKFNHLSVLEYSTRQPYPFPCRDEGMAHESLHPAGSNPFQRDIYFGFLDWTIPGN